MTIVGDTHDTTLLSLKHNFFLNQTDYKCYQKQHSLTGNQSVPRKDSPAKKKESN